MASILGLSGTQADILSVIYKIADDESLLLCDTKDLKALLQYAGENAQEFEDGIRAHWQSNPSLPSCGPSWRWRQRAAIFSSANPR